MLITVYMYTCTLGHVVTVICQLSYKLFNHFTHYVTRCLFIHNTRSSVIHAVYCSWKCNMKALRILCPLSVWVDVGVGVTVVVLSCIPSIHSSLKCSPWISQILWRTQQAATNCGTSHTLTSSHFSRHRHLPLRRPYACSTTTLALLSL